MLNFNQGRRESGYQTLCNITLHSRWMPLALRKHLDTYVSCDYIRKWQKEKADNFASRSFSTLHTWIIFPPSKSREKHLLLFGLRWTAVMLSTSKRTRRSLWTTVKPLGRPGTNVSMSKTSFISLYNTSHGWWHIRLSALSTDSEPYPMISPAAQQDLEFQLSQYLIKQLRA